MPPIFIYFLYALYIYFVLFYRYFNPKVRRLKRNIPGLLHQYSVYYQNLNHKEQKHFRKRMLRFISLKRFYRFDKSKVTDEMKILIAKSAVQITFGFSDGHEYEVFRNIAISDKEYRSHQTKNIHYGEANPSKSLIAFSWKKFMEGMANPHDSMNLGLHEFAHALFINNMKGYRNKEFFKEIREWHTTIIKLKKERTIYDFFRCYAFKNNMEFFAVSIEYFFENPKAFHQQLPELYAVMCRMLNQNPMLPNNGLARKIPFWWKF